MSHGGYRQCERAAMRVLLNDLQPGECGELGICYGGAECPFASEAQAIDAGVGETFCPACRVIHVYRAQEGGIDLGTAS